ncbi:hypothetical protein ZIOFF_065585 [Zingiber officinale]|uniref:Cysteine-rich receptor-like protein kinase 2 n=1 Tax=Zingiber officinale TaxID=94328 RepID=A0A8J5EXE0_ZINOF|nr:hypothetical protein ZIOFF_065585 [Zingiber officinale]
MDSIGSQIRTDSFGKATVGSRPDANYGLSQCYGDLSSLDCVLCYAEAQTVGPRQGICGNKTSKGRAFEQAAQQGLLEAVNKAPGNGGYAKISVHKTKGSNRSAYVLANCWRTLNETTCKACLENASASAVRCLPWSEGRVLNTGCFLRYSDTNFLNPDKSRSHQGRSIIAMVVAVVSALIVVAVGITVAVRVWKQRKLKKKRGLNNSVNIEPGFYNNSLNFKYSTLEKATRGFYHSNKLGQGGFGTVYKGTLVDGREIAVKRLFFNNKHRVADFYNEVNIINSVEHKNLVRVLGCSCSGPESLLVYEFLPNKSVDGFLFDPERGKELNWHRRLGIITGTAEGLSYLDQNSKIKIIHRDIKASNILLDIKFLPKIADFGLARTFQDDKSHISTAVAGTLGYMAPEYLARGQLTEKADVFSFGVLMIEIVTGAKFMNAWKHFQSGTIDEMIDPNILLDNYQDIDTVKEEIVRVFHVGLLCTQESPSLRPSVAFALLMLCTDRELQAPTKPPFTDETTMELDETKDVECHPSPYSIASVSFYPRCLSDSTRMKH